jgi:hypothetical protein
MNAQTLTQRRAIHAYNEAHLDAIYHAERQPEPAQMCAVFEDCDPPLVAMLIALPFCLGAWALFGWAVVAVIRAVRGLA